MLQLYMGESKDLGLTHPGMQVFECRLVCKFARNPIQALRSAAAAIQPGGVYAVLRKLPCSSTDTTACQSLTSHANHGPFGHDIRQLGQCIRMITFHLMSSEHRSVPILCMPIT